MCQLSLGQAGAVPLQEHAGVLQQQLLQVALPLDQGRALGLLPPQLGGQAQVGKGREAAGQLVDGGLRQAARVVAHAGRWPQHASAGAGAGASLPPLLRHCVAGCSGTFPVLLRGQCGF